MTANARGGESLMMELKEWHTDHCYQENDTEEISIWSVICSHVGLSGQGLK